MQIIRGRNYLISLQNIVEKIAEDSISRAFAFQEELDSRIENISFMPFKYRKSIYFDDENIRDLVFKGFVVPYEIDLIENQIIVIGINKYKKRLF